MCETLQKGLLLFWNVTIGTDTENTFYLEFLLINVCVDIKIDEIIRDEDIITKRQLNKNLQAQIKGDKSTIGEILVKMNFCSLYDITEGYDKQDELKHNR